ncbi:TolC family protein [Opitutus terrae]|uniref:Outer membrane efflux protein n=1 Tax=Opitutus terrae (strain DSM 11246 / JCM 15787 / PB90-1) TaxID=452637 RepID=B1ZZM8_OPITP|nr:TolC family protein [Opitutus terrae]ACB77214.1 outer membrane efflux protein [Opitutus terrae PB90-1]
MLRLLRLLAFAGVCSVLFVGSLPAQPLRSPVLPLPENYFPGLKRLLETAVKQAPRMIARNTDEIVAEAERTTLRAGQLPSMRAYGSYYPWTQDRRGDASETTTTQKVAYNVFLEQPLFHWGALKDASRIGELKVKIAQGDTVEAYRLLISEIRSQYLQLIFKRLSVERTRATQRMAEQSWQIARERFERKEISESDLFSARMGAEQARLWTDRFQEDYDTARYVLGKLCGMPTIPDEEVPREIPAIARAETEIDGLVRAFTTQEDPVTYGLENLRRQVDIEQLNYDIAKTRLRPKVNAVVGLTQDQQDYVYTQNSARNYRYEVQSLYTGVSVNWSIFDGFASRAAKASALARRRQAERTYEVQRENVLVSVRAKKRQLDFAARGLAMSEEYLALGERSFRTKEEDQKLGLASPTDLENARLQLFDARVSTFNARQDYLLRAADLLSATLNDPALTNLPSLPR